MQGNLYIVRTRSASIFIIIMETVEVLVSRERLRVDAPAWPPRVGPGQHPPPLFETVRRFSFLAFSLFFLKPA